MFTRRSLSAGLVAAGVLASLRVSAQPYGPPGYEGDRRYRDGDEEEEHRRFEERRREAEERRRAYYDQRGRPPTVIGLEEDRNRRVLGLQQELAAGRIGRREFDERVAQIDYELHSRLGQ